MLESASEFEKFVKSNGGLSRRSCSLCGASSFLLLGTRDRYGFDYPTGMCNQCGLVQQIRYYSDTQLQRFYDLHYRDIYDSGDPHELFELQRRTNKPFMWTTADESPSEKSVSSGKRVLDLGCGAGGNLLAFQDSGWECLGADYDHRYVLYGRNRGLNLILGGLDEIGSNKTFDLIILSHVLEHTEPVRFLEEVARSLAPGGGHLR
jgi:SAM-dependent methyltransferase